MPEVVREASHQDTVSPSGCHFMGISYIGTGDRKRHGKRRTVSCSCLDEQGHIIIVHILCQENGRRVTGCVLYLCLTKDAPQGVAVVKVVQ